MGSVCVYQFNNPSQVVFADEQSSPAWTFGVTFIRMVDSACALSSSHLASLLVLVSPGLGMVPETYGHNFDPFR